MPAWPALVLVCCLGLSGCSRAPGQPPAASAAPSVRLDIEARKKLRGEAEIAYSSAKFARSAELFSQLIAAEPRNAKNYLWRAQAYQRQGRLSEAELDLNRAVELAPTEQDPLLHRSRLALSRNQIDAALDDCDRAIALGGPQTAGAHVYRASMLLGQGRHQEALADCNEAMRLDPELLTAYNNRGLAHQALGEFDAALADFTRAIEGHRQFADPYNNRGALHMRLGHADEALADLSEAIRLEPLAASGYDNRSRLLLEQLNDPAGAAKDCTRLIQVVEREAKQRGASATGRKIAAIYVRRAEARRQLGQPALALADCQSALAIDGNCQSAKELLRTVAESQAPALQTQPAIPSTPSPISTIHSLKPET